MRKKYSKQNIDCLVCFFFKSGRPVCKHIHFNFIKTTSKTPFLKKSQICRFLTQKLSSKGQLFQNTAEVLAIKMHIFRQKISSILLVLDPK